MTDSTDLQKKESDLSVTTLSNTGEKTKEDMPSIESLKSQLSEASVLVDDIVLKNYLSKLADLEVIPLDDELKDITDIRLFKINEMVYQNNEYSTYKFASVFNSLQSLDCGIFIIADSDGKKTDFYMGVRSLDNKRTTSSLKETLCNALYGQFPGAKTTDLYDKEVEGFLDKMRSNCIAAVSCVAKNKDEEFKDNEKFIQGLEKFALAMQGQSYTAVVLAKSTPIEQLNEMRRAYEQIYTQLSPFANMQLSYGSNTALSISDALSRGKTIGWSHSISKSSQYGMSYSKSRTKSESKTTNDSKTSPSLGGIIKSGIGALVGTAGIVAAPFTGGLSLLASGAVGAIINGIPTSTKTAGTAINSGSSESETLAENESETSGETDTTNENTSENYTETKGLTSGTSNNMQLTMQNKTLVSSLERIDLQLKRIDECESVGMWECAAYFLSDSQETAEMAAGTYKSLMRGEKSGVETSAINFWRIVQKKQLTPTESHKNQKVALLREYVTNFIHPIFEYHSDSTILPVTASTLVSGNELAIQMGLPRKSVCGFPVIKHAEFGKEIVRYNHSGGKYNFKLGNIFNMGSVTNTEVRLDRDSLAMHTFITGSTGSGKSNTIYEILTRLRDVYNTPFLVIEPAKGEYKSVFGQFSDVSVYGTNPQKNALLRINPFSFPSDIHVLEHLDRLVEIFNACWPMYAAMPCILKDALERSYVEVGWNIEDSTNPRGEVFPSFMELLLKVETVINEQKYSADSKGDYSGALCTRIRSLTTGLNRQIFRNDELSNCDLFDKSVIIDLSRVGSIETKSLIMGLLIMKMNEYRMISGKVNSPLSHITVLEEAHNLLKRTSTEQSSESSNLLGKSVEMLSTSIAEMRTYGEGFIIADQSPGMLDMSVIRNTNTKIILRLPEYRDRELVGFAANLNKEQIDELSKLERGVAAVYQNDWIEPILVKINKCRIKEKTFDYEGTVSKFSETDIERQITHMLIQGRVSERLDFDTTIIRKHLASMRLTLKQKDFLEKYIDEYETHGVISIWHDEKFGLLSKYIGLSSGLESVIEDIVAVARDNSEVTEEIFYAIRNRMLNLSDEVMLALSHCLMKNFSIQKEEEEIRNRIYKQWVDAMKKTM